MPKNDYHVQLVLGNHISNIIATSYTLQEVDASCGITSLGLHIIIPSLKAYTRDTYATTIIIIIIHAHGITASVIPENSQFHLFCTGR